MNFVFKWVLFSELSNLELYRIMQLRQEVFVMEQECLFVDADGKDLQAWHFLALDQENLIGYARVLPAGVGKTNLNFGRVAVAQNYRGKGFGKLLLTQCLAQIEKTYPGQIIEILAQHYLLKFYESFQFKAVGEPFLYEERMHIKMLKFPHMNTDLILSHLSSF